MKNRNLNHKDDWATPPEFYNELHNEFNFNFDPSPFAHDTDKWDGEIEWENSNYINPLMEDY